MAHYAFLDENGIVIEVIAGRNEDEVVDGITDWEEYYSIVRGRKCLRTSYNAETNGFRKHYAGIGYTYNEELDAFIPPKCHDEATLNHSVCRWDCNNVSHTTIERQ